MFKLKLFTLLIIGLLISSCGDDDPEIPNEEEVITTLTYTLTPNGGGDNVELVFTDLDGDGGADPILQTAPLAANTEYAGTLTFLNETESPAEDITEEVMEEDLEHQVFFSTSVSGMTISYNDMDDDGNPLGLSSTVNTSTADNGTLTIILRHEPAKDADGVSDGDITNAGGETDIEVTFNIDVE